MSFEVYGLSGRLWYTSSVSCRTSEFRLDH